MRLIQDIVSCHALYSGVTRRAHWLIFVLVALATAACATGAYPLDILPEMHYQESQRTQEPPRFYPPSGSVPVTGKETPRTLGELVSATNPVDNNPATVAKGARLYQINCSPCHGPEAKGNGHLVQYFQAAGVRTPPDLTLGLPDGFIFNAITNGQGVSPDRHLTNMPALGYLLTPEERWTIIRFLKSRQAR
ncbi:MAG: putative cytochrome c subfamily [Dehalococcoidia bacterium]|nr:putative cytochrome c subfamily [Dehalococcoidia bacterium]